MAVCRGTKVAAQRNGICVTAVAVLLLFVPGGGFFDKLCYEHDLMNCWSEVARSQHRTRQPLCVAGPVPFRRRIGIDSLPLTGVGRKV